MLVKYEANPAGNWTQSIKFAAGTVEIGDTIEVTEQEYTSVTTNGYLLTVVEDKLKTGTQDDDEVLVRPSPSLTPPAGVASPSSTPAPSA